MRGWGGGGRGGEKKMKEKRVVSCVLLSQSVPIARRLKTWQNVFSLALCSDYINVSKEDQEAKVWTE